MSTGCFVDLGERISFFGGEPRMVGTGIWRSHYPWTGITQDIAELDGGNSGPRIACERVVMVLWLSLEPPEFGEGGARPPGTSWFSGAAATPIQP